MRMCRLRLPLLLLLPLPRLLLLLTSRRRRCAPLSSSRTLPFALCPSFGPLQTWTPPVPRLQLVHVPPTYTHTHTHAHVGTHMRGWRSTRSPKLMAASLARVHAKHRYVCVHLSVSMCILSAAELDYLGPTGPPPNHDAQLVAVLALSRSSAARQSGQDRRPTTRRLDSHTARRNTGLTVSPVSVVLQKHDDADAPIGPWCRCCPWPHYHYAFRSGLGVSGEEPSCSR
ncbi:uncharacterized protein SETTUDRAFT_39527 [Exserohilum turcica Et28A]|uniref:Secreted protein n=1 Tax=Exserohilum turcicum (strain 28A) TaxID=671987 RepID=R0KAD3_EXST2|nr:uncharacterized protein SETTUDRAFT_39527 [Exserohilum turcica Et28A]EOA86394.1 hypothetical protein SETTUDRAFT_39527 [Exserohilum turcica Et28A]